MQLGNYELDDIYCGDSAVMLAGLPDASIDLTVTSPPYDNLRSYHGYSWDFTTIATQLYRVTKPGGVVVWITGDETIGGSETGASFRQALGFMEIGFNLHDTMIYQKDSCPFPETTRYYPAFEYMFILSKGSPRTVNLLRDKANKQQGISLHGTTQRERDGKTYPIAMHHTDPGRVVKQNGIRQNVWLYSPGYKKSTKDDYAFDHPAIFPEALARDHVISWSNPGDIVLDPFAGSGTTAKMSKVLSRHWLGFDISQEYVTLAKKRVEYAPTPLPLLVENGQPKAEQTTLF